MKRVLVSCIFCLALTALSQIVYAESCSCSAPDRSCSTSITCSNGCWATCASGGSCNSGCVSGGGGGGIDFQTHSATPGPGQPEPLSWGSGEGVVPSDLSQRVSEHFGIPFVYAPDNAEEILNLDFKNLSLPDLRRLLARRGAVATSYRDPVTNANLTQTRFTVRADNSQMATIAQALTRVSAGAVDLTPTDTHARMTVDIKGVTVTDLTVIFADTERLIKK